MAIDYKDYYKILGVGRTADDKTIKQAYRRLARKLHPDVNKSKDATDRFKEINEAYEVLSDPEKRKRYDSLGPDWQRYAAGGSPFEGFRVDFGGRGGEPGDLGGFSDFFRTIFGDLGVRGGEIFSDLGADFGTRRGPSRARGEDVEGQIEIGLEDAFHGSRKTVSLEVDEPCAVCNGTGSKGKAACPACGGRGWARGRRRLDVRIPPGVGSGSRVRVAGEGAGGVKGGGRGDLYLRVRVTPHPVFERRGDDLYMDLPVTVAEAALGAEVEVPTLKGKVSMKIPPETSSGRTFRLPGYGMPRLKEGGAGDQYVRIKVVVPSGLSPRERELYQELGRLRPENPRSHLT
jgi:DnaJ-class molecular chaperone